MFVSGGRVPTGLEAVAWAREVERLGAGEIVLTCMDRDGTRDGYDLEITAAVSRAVGIPVVASGGAGRPEHLADAITLGGADAALAAGIFHFGQCTIREVKELFLRRGIPVRPRPAASMPPRRRSPAAHAMATIEIDPESAPVARVRGMKKQDRLEVDRLFEALVSLKGSDLHLKVGQPPFMRVKGALQPLKHRGSTTSR